MQILLVILFIVWLYLLWVFTRTKLDFFKFCIGSIGLFVFSMLWIQPALTVILSKMVGVVSGLFGELSGMYAAYYQYGLILIPKDVAAISFYIDYECSGIVEILAYVSMLVFFPIYTSFEKVVVGILGIAWIFLANVLRIFVICTLIFFFGSNIFYFAHTIFGRIVFYGLSILLYYYVFTRSHVVRQKVGNFKYGRSLE